MEVWTPLASEDAEGVASLERSSGLAQLSSVAVCTDPPKGADDLVHEETRITFISTSAAASLGIPVVTGEVNAQWRTWISEQLRYAECEAPGGVRVRYGVAVRLVVQFTSTDVDLKSGLPAIAAAAQLGRAQANVFLQVVGYPPGIPKQYELIWEPITVDNYADVIKRASDLRTHVLDDREHIRPTRLGVVQNADASEATDMAIGRVWGLGQIADGRSCSEALASIDAINKSEATRAAVLAAYRDTTGLEGCSPDRPDQLAEIKAQQIVGPFRLRRGLFG